MTTEVVAQSVLLIVGAAIMGVWAYRNVWLAPKVTRALVIDKTLQNSSMRLPDVLPGTGGVFNAATTNIMTLEINGDKRRYTANDEPWMKANVGDTVKVWIQSDTHVVGVYILNRARSGE